MGVSGFCLFTKTVIESGELISAGRRVPPAEGDAGLLEEAASPVLSSDTDKVAEGAADDGAEPAWRLLASAPEEAGALAS